MPNREFADREYVQCTPADKHPMSHYYGFKQESVILPKGHVRFAGHRPLQSEVRATSAT